MGFDSTKPYKTRGGRAVKILYTTRYGTHLVLREDTESAYWCDSAGRVCFSDKEGDPAGLINIQE